MQQRYHILQVGLGPIGLNISALLAQRTRAHIVAAIDTNPDLAGCNLGELIENDNIDLTISNQLEQAIQQQDVDIAVVTTTSSATALVEQIQPLIYAGISVITTCEELLFPWKTQPQLAKKLDDMAKKHNATILATGVNPGFLMDYLPTIITSLCHSIETITVNRVQDASFRRVPFQRKIGAGISRDEFNKHVQAGTLKHVGLPESVYYIAHVLGLDIDSVQEDIQPVMDNATVQGVQQQARGMQGKQSRIELNFIASMNNPNPQDTIIIQGKPNCELRIAPEVNGDIATTAVTVNAIASVLQARPGLQTMASIPPVHYWF